MRLATTLFLLLLLSAAPASAAPHITGLDTVTTAGHPVNVRAKFEAGFGFWGLRPDLRHKPVLFQPLQGGPGHVLSAITDRDGVGEAEFRADVPGVYRFRAALVTKPWKSAVSRVWVLDPAKPVVVLDIDGTLSSMTELLVPFMGARAHTYPGAPELVRQLATTHQIIYLTARDDALDKGTRAFLKRQGFPDAPILYNDTGLWTKEEFRQLIGKGHGEFKLKTLQGLQSRGVNLVLGLGNAETDAFAYEGAGIPSMIRTTQVAAGSSFRFTDYTAQLRPQLVGLGFLPASGAGIAQAVGSNNP